MKGIIIMCAVIIAAFSLLCLKINVTKKNQVIIINAIFEYQKTELDRVFADFLNGKIDEYHYVPAVSFEDHESFEKTLWRLWDWGYTRILPKDKFEIIKPYIKGNKA